MLVAGAGLKGAELYDPVYRTMVCHWATPDRAGDFHTATLLPNGKVLIVGGYNLGFGYLTSAELYDPAHSGLDAYWVISTSRRSSHTATLLPSGKVLVVGGSISFFFVTVPSCTTRRPGLWTLTGGLFYERYRSLTRQPTACQVGSLLLSVLTFPGRGTFAWHSCCSASVSWLVGGKARAQQKPEGSQDGVTLELNKPIERELGSEQRHSYQIRLVEGQYASVRVEQRGIDVVGQVTCCVCRSPVKVGSHPVITNPLFGEPEITEMAKTDVAPMNLAARSERRQGVTTGSDLSSLYFSPLRGTTEEGRVIKSLFASANLLTGSQATEAALKRVAAPSILHIATHGFFLQEAASIATKAELKTNFFFRKSMFDGATRAISANIKIVKKFRCCRSEFLAHLNG